MKPRLLFALALATPSHAGERNADTHAAERAQIQQLVDRFRQAILDKDGDAMSGMFMPGGSWLQGLDQASLDAVRARKPEARQFSPGSYTQFAGFVGTADRKIEEVFDNVRIETDGTVGTVYFDYRFLVDGKATNHGVETWQVVHADGAWKISAMLYSVILDDIH
ncbi:nuclear transport factor 2 family protein [Dyella sp. C9]|uniref:nuclear transport factor 2 family protein n=1 Tax=Dyella sp. C9 TaxID=2202154 RepID=UPI0013003AC9|nr:nuclear transport factor 2 family protein [Dyella sp. C9]